MRNFWLEGYVDGRETTVTGGPRRKEDGMKVYVYQREDGCSVKAVSIDCYRDDEGKLHTVVFNRKGERVADVITDR